MAFAALVLLLALPIAELWLLILLGVSIGAGWTIAYLILIALIGVLLLRRQGLGAMQRAMQSAAAGRPPLAETIESAGLMLAGMLLIVPGLITDALGLVLFVPPLRRWLITRLLQRAEVRAGVEFPSRRREEAEKPAGATPGQAGGPIIEGEFERLGETTVRPDPNRPKDDSKRQNGSASPWAH